MEAAGNLASNGIEAAVVNSRFASPLDEPLIVDLAGRMKRIITVEENVLSGGFGSNVLKLLQKSGLCDVQVRNAGIPDEFVEHGTQAILRSKYGLDAEGIENAAVQVSLRPAGVPFQERLRQFGPPGEILDKRPHVLRLQVIHNRELGFFFTFVMVKKMDDRLPPFEVVKK